MKNLEKVIIEQLLVNIKYINDLRKIDGESFISQDDTNDEILEILDCFFGEQRVNGIDIDSVDFLDEMFPTFGANVIRDAESGYYDILEKIQSND